MAMIRKQVYITAAQEAALKDAASDLEISEAELVREGIDKVLAARSRRRPVDPEARRKLIEHLRNLSESAEPPERTLSAELSWSRADLYRDHQRRLDDTAWEEELEFIEKRMNSMPEGGSTKKWRREDSYDSRRSRLPD